VAERPPDLIVSGRIATLAGSTGFGWAEALAVSRGRVVAVGSRADVEVLAETSTRRWRLAPGSVATPSITDAHLHLALAALAADQPDLSGLDLAGVATALAAVDRQRRARGDRESWLLGHGWSFERLGSRPSAALLDRAADGRPVALWAHDHHSRWVSSRAVALANLADQPDPPGGRIDRDADGRPTGILFERAAGLVDAAIPTPDGETVSAAVIAYAAELARLGVTAVHDPGGVAPDPAMIGGPTLYRSLALAGRLPLRVMACIREEQLGRAIEMGFRTGRTEAALSAAGGPASGRYLDGWLKLFSDGALGSRTAALLEPYERGDPAGPPPGGPRGLPLHESDELAALAGRAAQAGIASQIHAIGDAAVRTVLGVLADVPHVAGAWHRVEHAQLVHPDDVARFAALGVAASVQPCHLLSDASAVRVAWGARSGHAFPLADLDRAGVLLPLGTDAPVEVPDPWRGLAAAVTRRDAAWPDDAALHPEQALSLDRALRAACLDGPRSARLSDQGHLGVGARADLLVLPGAVFAAADTDLATRHSRRAVSSGVPVSSGSMAAQLGALRPLLTVLDGEPVWCAPGFDPETGAGG
jgi:hypothetical protein